MFNKTNPNNLINYRKEGTLDERHEGLILHY